MVSSLSSLSETVDRSTLDRRLADEIMKHLTDIKEKIKQSGVATVVVDGTTFNVKLSSDKALEVTVAESEVSRQKAG
jgi:hypothetical protein